MKNRLWPRVLIVGTYVCLLYLLFLRQIGQVTTIPLVRAGLLGSMVAVLLALNLRYRVFRITAAVLVPAYALVLGVVSIYHAYFRAVPVPGQFRLLGNAHEILPIALGMVTWWQILLLAGGLLCGVSLLFKTPGRDLRPRQVWGGYALVLLMALVSGIWAVTDSQVKGVHRGVELNRFAHACFYGPNYAIGRYGYVIYAWQTLRSRQTSVDPDDVLPIPNPPRREQPLHDRRPNVIVIQVESLDYALINRVQNGVELTPFLNQLSRVAFVFPNFYAVHGQGGSSDAELAALTGILPPPRQATFAQLPLAHLPALPRMLKAAGYQSHGYHGVVRDLWSRRRAYPELGFDSYHGGDAYMGRAQGWNSNDREFLQQTLPKLEELADQGDPFFAYLITQSMHAPHQAIEAQLLDQEIQHPNQKLANYFRVAHFTDRALQEFVAGLRDRDLLANTALVIYGDHCTVFDAAGYRSPPPEGERVPLFILLPWQKGWPVETWGGHLDIAPTILDIAGLPGAAAFTGRSLMRFHPRRLLPMDVKDKHLCLTPIGNVPVLDMRNTLYQQVLAYHTSQFKQVSAPVAPSVLHTTQFIAHAMGSVDGQVYTNSLEAFERSYQLGVRVFEIDMLLSKDGQLVGLHDAPDASLLGLPGMYTDYDLAELMARPVAGAYTLLDMGDVLGLMQRYPDMWLVPDMKADFRECYSVLIDEARRVEPALLGRVIPQIYQRDQLETLNRLHSFPEVIYTLYRSADTPLTVARFLETHPQVAAVAMSRLRFGPIMMAELASTRADIFVHTVNSMDEMAMIQGMGGTGIFCDMLFREPFAE